MILKYVLIATIAASSVSAATRDSRVVYAFKKVTVCPATGKVGQRCAGYVVDHIVPLCAGGSDTVANMQYQTKAQSYIKDVLERRQCALARK